MSLQAMTETVHAPADLVTGNQAPSGTQPETPASTAPAEGKASQADTKEPEAPKAESTIAAIVKEKKRQLALRREKESAEARVKELEAKIAALEPEAQKLTKARESKNPIEALMAAGFTYEDAVQFQLNGGQATPEMEIRAIRAEMVERDKKAELDKKAAQEKEIAEAKASEARAVAQFRASVKTFIGEHPDDYELTNLYDPDGEMIFATIEAHFDKTQKILSAKEAADLVEKHCEAEIFEKAAKTKKAQSRLKPAEPEKKETAQASVPGSRTLSNSMSATTPTRSAPRSEDERIQRALAALERAR